MNVVKYAKLISVELIFKILRYIFISIIMVLCYDEMC